MFGKAAGSGGRAKQLNGQPGADPASKCCGYTAPWLVAAKQAQRRAAVEDSTAAAARAPPPVKGPASRTLNAHYTLTSANAGSWSA